MADHRPRSGATHHRRRLVPVTGVRRWTSQARAFTRRYLRQHTRSPVGLVFLVAWPGFWYLLVAHLLFGQTGADAAAIGAAKAAFAVSFGLFGALTVSMSGVVGSYTADVQTKRYRKLRSLPVSPAADLVGRFVAGATLSLVSYTGLLVIGAIDGAAFVLRWPWSPAVVVASVVAFAAIGVAAAVAIAAAVPRPEYATTLATAVVLAGFFGTGLNGVTPGLFPGPPGMLNVIPISLITRLQLHHLVAPAVVGPGTFSPPELPRGPAAIAMTLGYGLGSLALGAAVVGRTAYAGELGE